MGDNIMAYGAPPVNLLWLNKSYMKIYNANIRGISAPKDFRYWPNHLDFSNINITYFTENLDNPGQSTSQDVKWFSNLLKRQEKFDPQPYKVFENILNNTGYHQEADAVGFASKDRELVESFLAEIFSMRYIFFYQKF